LAYLGGPGQETVLAKPYPADQLSSPRQLDLGLFKRLPPFCVLACDYIIPRAFDIFYKLRAQNIKVAHIDKQG
jgi:hypothetical protein